MQQLQSFFATPYAPLIVVIAILMLIVLVILPIVRKVRRKRIKSKETRDIMKDLFTWRHLSQLVKGGEEHDKAKHELSDNIIRINELLQQGFEHVSKNIQRIASVPWFIVVGEPRSGKSTLLEAGELELSPSEEENNPEDDPRKSLPLRVWTGAGAVIYDISGKVFFDRWLEGSSAEWNHIVRQICRGLSVPLNGIIITVPTDALLADDANLSSKKAILMANELSKLLRESGMRLPCYFVVTKLDMVSGFKEYAEAFTGNLRHQILGFESDSNQFNEAVFKQFWEKLCERLHSGAKQLLTPAEDAEDTGSRMDKAGKVWGFPGNFDDLYNSLRIYLEALFGEGNFHNTKNTVFEGVYFTSSKEIGFSFSPGVAAIAGRGTDEMLIPAYSPPGNAATYEPAVPDDGASSTALVAADSARSLIAPYIKKTQLLKGYFIRDMLHKRVFVPSPHAEFVRKEAIRRHIPQYLLCAFMIFMGLFWLSGAIFRARTLRMSLVQAESFYGWLDSMLTKGGYLRSPLVKETEDGRFILDNSPLEGESLSSRLQFYYNALSYRDLKIPVPPGFKLSGALVFGFDKNMGYRRKAFIANQLHKSMVRLPVIKGAGNKLIEHADTQTLDNGVRDVIVSFVSLDEVQGTDFAKFFASSKFKLDAMLRYLMPDLSNDTMALLDDYLPKYDRSGTLQMDTGYIYSEDYQKAKQAALDTVLSAWKRGAVYPDSIYGKIRLLVSVSEEITENYGDILNALNRVNNVSTLEGVQDAVYEWQRLTGRFKSLAAEGRAAFEEVRLLMKAAHIPLVFDAALPQVKSTPGKGLPALVKKPALDAFGDNLINNYLFNDMVISYAVREYTRLFDSDMEFVKSKTKGGENSVLGRIIAEQNIFSKNLNREVDGLKSRAGALQNNALLSQKADDKPDSLSLFMVAERIINLASDIPIPRQEAMQNTGFDANWQRGQDAIKSAQDAFDAFVKPYLENKNTAVLAANARVMLLAEAYYNRYVIFTTSLAFLNTFEGNIAAVVESRSDGTNIFAFSENAIENLFGGFYYNRGYDPPVVKLLLDNTSSFASLFAAEEDAKNLPLFLRNVDKRLYQPPAFMDYLSSYIAYWGNYPEHVYVSAGTWERFKNRASEYKSFQINSILLSLYVKSLEVINQIDDALLTPDPLAAKNQNVAALGDRQSLLNQFQSVEAEKMFTAWNTLPADPLQAYAVLQGTTEKDLKSSYFAVYASPAPPSNSTGQDAGSGQPAPEAPALKSISIGWWNNFALDGASILAREADRVNMAHLVDNAEKYKARPLCIAAGGADGADGAEEKPNALTLSTMREIAELFGAMGAGISAPSSDPADSALHHNLFAGSAVQTWAATVYQIAAAITDTQKPLTWTIYQPPVDVQSKLAPGRRLLAINRFRYVEVSAGGNPRLTSTYMNEKISLLQGHPEDGNLTFKFYKTSRDAAPAAVIAFNNPWSVFDLHTQPGRAADDKGNAYIPLFFEDAAGQYVYYVELEFTHDMPPPASWYTPATWLNIMTVGGMITERR
jgi:hypothetical protein